MTMSTWQTLLGVFFAVYGVISFVEDVIRIMFKRK